jgi:6-phosphogluconolactonase
MTPDEAAAQVAEAFDHSVRVAVDGGRRFRCAVPGGSVALRVFPRLTRLALPWSAIDLFLADDRMVGPGDPESNQRAVYEHWLRHLDGARPAFHAMPTSMPAEDAARAASEALIGVAGTPPRLDLVMLGVGPDGHVASLFPGQPWRDNPDWVIAVHDAPKPPPERLSLGFQTLAAATELWMVAFGSEKAAAIRAARETPHSPLPVAIVAGSGPRVRWFLDDAASAP